MEEIQIVSDRLGEVEIDSSQIIEMPEGIIGFAGFSRYAYLPHDSDGVFAWLQCIDNPSLAFVVTNPMIFFPNYRIDGSEPDFARLNLDQFKVLAIVTVPNDPKQITGNLLAPLVIDSATNRGWQVILEKTDYPIRQPLFAAPPAEEAEATEGENVVHLSGEAEQKKAE